MIKLPKEFSDSFFSFAYQDLDKLRFMIMKYTFISIVLFVSGSLIIDIISGDGLHQSVLIGIPIVLIAMLGLYILPRIRLETTVYVTFTLMYAGIYIAGYMQVLNSGFVILVLIMILILTLFFIKRRLIVIVICLVAVSLNLLIIRSSNILLQEYLLGSLAFLFCFYALSTLIFKYQDQLLVEIKNIQSKNEEIELLLKEIHHRVKNNLQTISSILYLQSMKVKDKEAKEAIKKGQLRIESIALIHKNIYQKDKLWGVEMREYITSLASNLSNAYDKSENVDFDIEIESCKFSIDTAIPIGLILNEVLTHSLEFGFRDNKKGQVRIAMHQNPTKQYVINIADNDSGKNLDKNEFGSKLIELLTQQIDALFIEKIDNGYWCQITFTGE